MKEKRNWKAAAVMLSCTVFIVAGGAVGLNAAMRHLQSEELAAESSGTAAGQGPDEEEIMLSGIRQTDASGLKSIQAGQVEQEHEESKESNKNTIAIMDKRGNYFSRSRGAFADSTEEKTYFHTLFFNDRLYYLDQKTEQFGYLCGKDGCKHDTKDCNALFSTELKMDTLQVVDDKLYVFRGSYRRTPYLNASLYRMDLDGSNREKVTVFRAYAALGNARIMNGAIYAEGELEDGSGVRLFKQSLYGYQNAKEIFPVSGDDWTYRGIEITAAVGNKLYFKATRYKEKVGEDPTEVEFTIWEYDTKSGLFTELLNSSKDLGYSDGDLSFFVADNYLYYAACEYARYPDRTVTHYPVMRKNLVSGQTEETTFGRGTLEGYDGVYCYISTYGNEGRPESVEVYSLDGEHVQSISLPGTSGEYEYAMSCVGCTYDTLVLHDGHYEDDHYYEDVYVYDKKQIGKANGTWTKVSLHDWQEAGEREKGHEMIQE